ncbi:hypothetical protein LTS18_012278 [Coniosporium uncinatum]|uniref:Uncharacterized protein n=1 Tax=Coniosporium uncinatum TaxID=93489 RepID=A0ACC3DC40_9PEZI|nr:hypothetical protein LTS18_012278 [Coniosporium uncinatum]
MSDVRKRVTQIDFNPSQLRNAGESPGAPKPGTEDSPRNRLESRADGTLSKTSLGINGQAAVTPHPLIIKPVRRTHHRGVTTQIANPEGDEQANNLVKPTECASPWTTYDREYKFRLGGRYVTVATRKQAVSSDKNPYWNLVNVQELTGDDVEEQIPKFQLCEHANIVSVRNIFRTGNTFHLCFEYMSASLEEVACLQAHLNKKKLAAIVGQVEPTANLLWRVER